MAILTLFMLFGWMLYNQYLHRDECRVVLNNLSGESKAFTIETGNESDMKRARRYMYTINVSGDIG